MRLLDKYILKAFVGPFLFGNIEKLRSVFLKSLYIKLKGGLNNESKAYTWKWNDFWR